MKVIKGCDVVYGFSFDMEEKYRVSLGKNFLLRLMIVFTSRFKTKMSL